MRRFAHRIAARTAIASRRRGRSRAAMHEPLQEELRLTADPSPHAQSLALRRQRLLAELLETLPEQQAETMALRVVLGFSLAEVAAATAAPENTVRSRLRLARETLRERIAAEPELSELLGGEP